LWETVFLKMLNVTQSTQDHSEIKLTEHRGRNEPVYILEVFIAAPDQAFTPLRANRKSAIVTRMSTSRKARTCGACIHSLGHSKQANGFSKTDSTSMSTTVICAFSFLASSHCLYQVYSSSNSISLMHPSW
jgi:hypothetical protein